MKSSAAQFFLQDFINHAGVGLAAGRLHHLADEKADQLALAGLILFDLSWIIGNHLIDQLPSASARSESLFCLKCGFADSEFKS